MILVIRQITPVSEGALYELPSNLIDQRMEPLWVRCTSSAEGARKSAGASSDC